LLFEFLLVSLLPIWTMVNSALILLYMEQ